MKRVLLVVLTAGVTAVGFGCGGGGGSEESQTDTVSAAEAHNEAILKEAETKAESQQEIEDQLVDRLGTFYYLGVDETFLVPDENFCSVYGVLTKDEIELETGGETEVLLSPDGQMGVEVGIFSGSKLAPCLIAVGEALGWTGEAIVPSGPLSKAAYLREADASCKVTNDLSTELFRGEMGWEELAKAGSEFRLAAVRGAEEFEALQPPASLRRQANEYAAMLREKLEFELTELQAAARVNAASSVGDKVDPTDEAEFDSAGLAREANYDARQKLAGEMGLKVCAS
jgi:hypothetical protein